MGLPKRQLPKKSLWNPETLDQWRFYCPHCQSPRQIPFHPNPYRPKNYLRVALTTAVFVALTFQWFEWKGAVAFIPFWSVFEVWYRIRSRIHLNCKYCGFDPFVYLSDPQRARAEIETFWRKKFSEKGIPYPEKEGANRPAPSTESDQKPMPTPNVAD